MSAVEGTRGTDRVTAHAVKMNVPAQPDVVQVVRAVIGSFASRLAFSLDEIDDLRLATSEAVTHLLEEPPGAPSITIGLIEIHDGVEITASRSAATEWPPSGARHSLTTLILRALTDESYFERNEDGFGIRFIKRWARTSLSG